MVAWVNYVTRAGDISIVFGKVVKVCWSAFHDKIRTPFDRILKYGQPSVANL